MSFEIFTDSASALTQDLLKKHNIHMISYHMDVGGEIRPCYVEEIPFNEYADKYYTSMRDEGVTAKTSLINASTLEEAMRPSLEAGKDVVFLGMSSGISGTIQSANIAALDLMDDFPNQKVAIIDSLSAAHGEALLVLELAKQRDAGKSLEECLDIIDDKIKHLNQFFTVDNLTYLKRGGRISGTEAVLGTMLSIKPILKATPEGTIVAHSKVRSRRKSLETLIGLITDSILDAENQTIAISHCMALEEANAIADVLRTRCQVKDVLIGYFDLCTGSHVGPGGLAIFCFGKERE